MDFDLIKNNRKQQEKNIKTGIQKNLHNFNGKSDALFGKEVMYGNTKAIIVDSSECTAWKPIIRIITISGKDEIIRFLKFCSCSVKAKEALAVKCG